MEIGGSMQYDKNTGLACPVCGEVNSKSSIRCKGWYLDEFCRTKAPTETKDPDPRDDVLPPNPVKVGLLRVITLHTGGISYSDGYIDLLNDEESF